MLEFSVLGNLDRSKAFQVQQELVAGLTANLITGKTAILDTVRHTCFHIWVMLRELYRNGELPNDKVPVVVAKGSLVPLVLEGSLLVMEASVLDLLAFAAQQGGEGPPAVRGHLLPDHAVQPVFQPATAELGGGGLKRRTGEAIFLLGLLEDGPRPGFCLLGRLLVRQGRGGDFVLPGVLVQPVLSFESADKAVCIAGGLPRRFCQSQQPAMAPNRGAASAHELVFPEPFGPVYE